MAFKLFGYTILNPSEILGNTNAPSLVPPRNDGSAIVNEGGLGVFGGYAVDFDTYSAYTNEIDLINQYRDLALQPEVDEAINSIINEMIVREDGASPVSINLDQLPQVYDETFREQVLREFQYTLTMLDFNDRCHDIAKQFYVDGRMFYDLIIDENHPQHGIIEVRNIDPRTIRPIREVRNMLHHQTGARLTEVLDEYFLFNPVGFRNMSNIGTGGGLRVARDRVAYINSGIFTPGNVTVLSHLHKAIKPYNQLRMVEDATVIYRITRAPERRVFYVDVADLPTARAEQYMQDIASRYRNRVVYDTNTGEVRDDRKFQSMLEDFFLPRRSNGRGTEITTLQGGQNLGEMSDVDYFRKKLYKALTIPSSRLEQGGNQFQLGRTTEITRDEIQFSRFLERLRNRLSTLFDEILSRHLTLIGVIRSRQQWKELRQYIRYEFVSDSYFAEIKRAEIMKERMELVQGMQEYVGKYFSEQYIRDNVLQLTTLQQERIKMEIAEERRVAQLSGESGMEPAGGGGGFGGMGGGMGMPPEPPGLGIGSSGPPVAPGAVPPPPGEPGEGGEEPPTP